MRKSQVLKGVAALVLVTILLCSYVAAQQSFLYKATLDNVAHSGFYSVHLSPAIVAECQLQLGDIRIKDNAGLEVPYIVKQQTLASAASNFILFPLFNKNNPAKIILQNKGEIGTNELVLFIKNSAAVRTITLSGSDDTSHWFVIKENIVLFKNDKKNDETSFTQNIQFPYSNYRYFQLSMQGRDSLPLNIFKAGVYQMTSLVNNNYDLIPKPEVDQQDSSDKKSYIRLLFDNKYRINKLQLYLTGAKFFNRSFTLFDGSTLNNAVLASGNATSRDSSITVNLQVKTNALLLVINNLDNSPLTLSKATAQMLPLDLITYLDAGKNYNLFFGDSTLQAPVYDLQYFTDSIRADVNAIAIKNIETLAVKDLKNIGNNNHSNTWVLWSIIIAVLLLLIYFSYTLLKDINQKSTNTDVHL